MIIFICLSITIILFSLIFSIIVLLTKFRAGNDAKYVLLGWPQAIYYSVNLLTFFSAIILAESAGKINFTGVNWKDFITTVIASIGFGGAGFVLVHYTNFTQQDTGANWGPSVMITKLLSYVEQKIDQKRAAGSKLMEFLNCQPLIVSHLTPQDLVGFVFVYCLAESERVVTATTSLTKLQLKATLDGEDPSLTDFQKVVIMLVYLQKTYGKQPVESALLLFLKDPVVAKRIEEDEQFDAAIEKLENPKLENPKLGAKIKLETEK